MKVFAKSPCVVGESPRWNASERRLYWVDVAEGLCLRQREGDPVDAFEVVNPRVGKIGALACVGENRLLLFAAGCKVWDYVFGGTPVLKWTLAGHEDQRFNDVLFADGRFFCGIAKEQERPGELWSLSRDGQFNCIESATNGMPNGMGISPDCTTFYFAVTDEGRIYAYDYSASSGALSNRRVLIDGFAAPGLPDGVCVDHNDGSLWIAMWDGGRLEHRSASGRLLGEVRFPMRKVTSAEIADGRIYVTTGNKEKAAEAYFKATNAGSVFEFNSKICL